MSAADDPQFRQRMQRVEGLVRAAERFADPAARDATRELVSALMDLHAAGLARLLELAGAAGGPGRELVERFADDELVSNLLLLHGLHPLDLSARVQTALERVRPSLRAHGGDVELVAAEGEVVRLRLVGQPSAAHMLRHIIEEAVYEAAPDAAQVLVEGVPPPPGAGHLIPLPVVGARP